MPDGGVSVGSRRTLLREVEEAHRRRWSTLAVLCLCLVVISLDNTILNVAIPTLSQPAERGGLGATASELQWILDAYIVVFAGLLLTTGSLGDRFGRHRFLTIGLALFGTASALSAFSPSPGVLIAARSIMGVAAALIMPATLSILSNVFTDPRERRRAIGIWAGVSACGSALGPVTGGALIAHFWWGSIFLVNVPVVLAALLGGYLFVPDSRDPVVRRLDPVGAVLSVVALTAVLWAIIEAPSHGWASAPVVTGFAVGGALVAAFVLWELRRAHPMLDIRLFENPRFSVASGAIALTFLALYGTSLLLTQYLQAVRGLSPVAAGALLIPQATVFFVSAWTAPRFVQRYGGTRVIAVGLALLAAGMASMALLGESTGVPLVIAVTCLVGLGVGQILAPATDSIMGAVPRERAGVGSAMNDTTRQIGGALGVAVLGSILSSRYHSQVTERLRGLPEPLLARVSDNVREATTVALSDAGTTSRADRIIDASHTAFLSGMGVAVLAAATVVLVAIVAVVVWLPARAHDEGIDGEPLDEPARHVGGSSAAAPRRRARGTARR